MHKEMSSPARPKGGEADGLASVQRQAHIRTAVRPPWSVSWSTSQHMHAQQLGLYPCNMLCALVLGE